MLFPALTACAARFVQEDRGVPRVAVVKDAPAPIERPRIETPRTAKQEESKEMIAFEVYRRGGRYFVTAWARGSQIYAVNIPDVVPVEPTAESIGAAFRKLEPPIREALAQVQRGDRHPEEEDDPKHWQRMGAKSYRQFLHSASYCDVLIFDEGTKIAFMKFSPVMRDFAGSKEEPDAKLGPDVSYEDIARIVLEIFDKNPPPPGDKPAVPKRPRKTAAGEQ